MNMELADFGLALCVGIGLAAACGFRVFAPLFVMSLAAHGGHLQFIGAEQWIGSDLALITLGCATALEIGAYYIPWLDNALDTVATPAAAIAGTMATATFITGMDPVLQWSVSAIAGGGAALTVQAGTVAVRGLSTLTTGGLGNSAVSTAEAGAAVGVSVLAISLPVLALIVVLSVLVAMARFIYRRRRAARLALEATAQHDAPAVA